MSTNLMQDPAFAGDVSLPSPENLPIPTTPEDVLRQNIWQALELNLDSETKDRLVEYVYDEIEKARLERGAVAEDWKRWQTDYWAKPATTERNFPFRRSANIVVPLTAIACEAIYARLMNTFFATKPFFTVQPRSASWIDIAKPVEDWLETELENDQSVDIYNFASQALFELTKLGTAIGKSGYVKDIKKTVRFEGGDRQDHFVTAKDGAVLDYVPCANFLCRAGYADPNEAPWCGEELKFSWSQLKRMALQGRFWTEAIDEIKHYWVSLDRNTPSNEYREHIEKLTKDEPLYREEFDTQEIWLSFDVDKDGIDEEIVVDFHYDSKTLLHARYNHYEDLRRPYRVGKFIPVEGRLWAIGVGKQNEQFQQEITTIRRQRLDNATLANMRMIAIRKGSGGYGPGEPIFPGKMWFLDDVNDIAPIQMSEIYQSSLVNEDSVNRDSEKRTGVNDVIVGAFPRGTPGTATGDLTRLEEGSKKFDLVVKNVRRWFNLLGRDIIANFQEFGPTTRTWTKVNERGQWVEQALSFPTEHVSTGATIFVTVTDSQTNKAVEQRQWMEMFTILDNHYQKSIQLAMMLAQLNGDPSMVMQIAEKALLGSDEALKRLLETFKQPGTERFLLGSGNLNEQSQQVPPTTFGAAIGGTPGAEIQSRLAGIGSRILPRT